MIEPYEGVFPTIEPTAFIHHRATVIGDVQIGAQSSVWPGAVLRGDDGVITVGRNTSIQDGSVLHNTTGISETHVGDRVTVGHNVTLHGAIVEDEVLIGMGSVILDNARIGTGTIVAAGTVIPMNKEIPSGVLVLGNPFKIARELRDQDRQWIEFSWRAYLEKSADYLRAAGRPRRTSS